MKVNLRSGNHHHMGARFDGEGTNFAVFSANAARINLSLFAPDGMTELDRLPLPERTGDIWHGYAPGVRPGDLYGYRAEGIYAPDQGHRFNPNKLLMDPYARELSGSWTNNTATLGYVPSAASQDLSFDGRDSAAFVPKSVVSDPLLFNNIEARADSDWEQTLIYEAHPKGLTMEHPAISENVRGTYEALASEPMLEHLHKLGVTAVELLPVHSFLDDGFLLKKGLRNYWGYNTIGFFAPEPRYFGPNGLAGFRNMVRRFHAAGIKVILDVVYNHTAEGDHRGPTLCYRGLDNASYYRLINGQPRFYVNDTGTGNTVNLSNPHVLRLVMDSLRFWVQQMGIDGFRFDLATTLGREDYGFDRRGGFFDAIRQDPILAEIRLIAEPWDIGPGGYQLGGFPAEFSEWNDSYRDTVRRYWRFDHHSAQELGARLLGSADKFERGGRRAWTSVNFITSHDGFTLADVTRYNERHNLDNGENGADGHHTNLSDNFGIEGETDDQRVRAQRALRQRNMLATLFLSQGTPMLLAGDEFSNSQRGNNNAYAQDNSIGWLNWDKADTDLVEFVSRLSEFRRRHPCLWQSRFLHGTERQRDGLPDVEWSDFKGDALHWRDPGLSNLCLTLRMSADIDDGDEGNNSHDNDNGEGQGDTVFIVFNRDGDEASVRLPKIRKGHHWVRAIDTAATDVFAVCELDGEPMIVAGHSVVAAVSQPDEAPR
jgi:glycogen operon protein